MLNTFEAQPLRDEEGSAINLEDEASNFSIKYLTSSNLMGLEVGVVQDRNRFSMATCFKQINFIMSILSFSAYYS